MTTICAEQKVDALEENLKTNLFVNCENSTAEGIKTCFELELTDYVEILNPSRH